MKSVLESFKVFYASDRRGYTRRSSMTGMVTYGASWLVIWFNIMPGEFNTSETSGLIGFWWWVCCVLCVGNLVGWFVVERVRLFAVFAYLGGVAIFPFAFFIFAVLGYEGVSWYWQQLGWILLMTVVIIVWQGLVFWFYLPAEKIKTEWQRTVLWAPTGVCIVIGLALCVVLMFFSKNPKHLREGEPYFLPGMEWVLPMSAVLLAGATWFAIVFFQFFRLCAFVRGGSWGDRSRYGGVFDGFTPGGAKPAGSGVEDDPGLGGRVLGGDAGG